MFHVNINKILVFVLFLLTSYCFGAISQEQSNKIINEIDRGMKANLGLVKSAEGIRTYKSKRFGNHAHLYEEELLWTLKDNRVKVLSKSNATYSIETMSDHHDNTYRTSYLYPNSQIKDISTSNFYVWHHGSAREKYFPFHPYYYGLTFNGVEMQDYIKDIHDRKWEFKVLGKEILDGDACYVMEQIYTWQDSKKVISHWWIDPQKGYGIVKWVSWLEDNNPFWLENYEYTSIQDPKTKKQFWYPKSMNLKFYNPDSTPTLQETREMLLTFTKINQSIGNKEFDLSWKPGSHIYVWPENSKQHLDDYTIEKSASMDDIMFGKVPLVPYAIYLEKQPKVSSASSKEQSDTSDSAEEGPLQGKQAMDFTLNDLNGKSYTLKDLKGKVVLLDFWATWCPPCRKELPDIEKLHREFKNKGLVVLGINEETPSIAGDYVKKDNYTFPILSDTTGSVFEQYNVQGIPTVIVIGKDGIISSHFLGERNEKVLRDALKSAGL